jgi:hypothetical protein
MMIAFSAISTFQVRFPAGDNSTSLLHLTIFIRDTLNSIVEFNMSSISVVLDSAVMTNLINNLQSSSNTITNNPIVQLLAGGNQNTVGQVIISLSQQSNQINNQNIENATSGNTLNFDHRFTVKPNHCQTVFQLQVFRYHHWEVKDYKG